MNWTWEGRAWTFGDDVPNDEALMPLAMCRAQEYDPAVLAKHCFEQVLPDFAAEVKPGDIVFAGRNFGHGNPHIQGFLGLKGCGVGLVVASMARGPLRACINAGVPILRFPGVTGLFESGDRVRVDFSTGRIENLRTGHVHEAAPMPAVMRDIVAAGGGIGYMLQRLAAAAATPSRAEGATP
jgi:3-isopropylmalate dehydratase small subunit